MTRYTIPALFARGFTSGFVGGGTDGGSFFVRPNSSFRYLIDSTLGHPPLRHLLVLLAAAVPPVLVAIWLLRRARRPEPPQLAVAPSRPAVTDLAVTDPAVTGPAAGTGQS